MVIITVHVTGFLNNLLVKVDFIIIKLLLLYLVTNSNNLLYYKILYYDIKMLSILY